MPPGRVFNNHHDLLALPDLDLVEILLPHHLHHPVTLDALAAGKHVSVQKPMALTLAEADEMIAAASAAEKTLRVYENFIFYPPVARAKALIDAGEIGDPLTIRIKSNAGFSPTAWHVPLAAWAWRFNPEICGGGPLLFDDGHHKFALAWHFMGLAEQVHAWIGEMELMPGRVLDTPAIVSWKFPGNRFGSLEAVYSPQLQIDTRYYAQDDRVEITGTKGVLWINGGHGRLTDAPALAALPRWQDPHLRRHPDRLGAQFHPRHPPSHRRLPQRRPAPPDRRRRPHNPALPPRRPPVGPQRSARARLNSFGATCPLAKTNSRPACQHVTPDKPTDAQKIWPRCTSGAGNSQTELPRTEYPPRRRAQVPRQARHPSALPARRTDPCQRQGPHFLPAC